MGEDVGEFAGLEEGVAEPGGGQRGVPEFAFEEGDEGGEVLVGMLGEAADEADGEIEVASAPGLGFKEAVGEQGELGEVLRVFGELGDGLTPEVGKQAGSLRVASGGGGLDGVMGLLPMGLAGVAMGAEEAVEGKGVPGSEWVQEVDGLLERIEQAEGEEVGS